MSGEYQRKGWSTTLDENEAFGSMQYIGEVFLVPRPVANFLYQQRTGLTLPTVLMYYYGRVDDYLAKKFNYTLGDRRVIEDLNVLTRRRVLKVGKKVFNTMEVHK